MKEFEIMPQQDFLQILDVYRSLSYHSYNVRMKASKNVVFDAWPGAIIRNNLLYAAEQIPIQKAGKSLREQIDVFPLEEAHPLYKELKEGFPKGYVLTDFTHTQTCSTIPKDGTFSFTLTLIGRFNDYRYYFFEAIRTMCERGVGKPLTSFQLIDIKENESSPVTLSDFLKQDTGNNQGEITIRFITPVSLYRLKTKKNTHLSYQDKTNRFPSFYQLIRSSISRLQKLYVLYVDPSASTPSWFDESILDTCLEKAGHLLLQSAEIRYTSLPNTQKKEKINDLPLSGYTGKQIYSGNINTFLPLLKSMEGLGVGDNTVYGLGRYEIE